MRDLLVDSNVILDVVTADPVWLDWSATHLDGLADRYAFVINPIIYAEVSIGFDRIEDLEAALPHDFFRRDALPWEAAFLAGKCFVRNRRAGGAKRSPLPDFFIGAHAPVRGMPLLTRDATRYRSYFPRLTLVAP